MAENKNEIDPSAYEEEKLPFDAAMRQILKAKPKPRKAKQKATKKKPS